MSVSPLQAVPGTAPADGVDPGGGRPHRAPAELLRGQRRRPAGRQAAAPRRGLRAAANKVRCDKVIKYAAPEVEIISPVRLNPSE